MNTLDRIVFLKGKCYESDVAFEKDIGIPEKTVNDWKRGKSQSFMKMLPQIAKALNTTTAYLLCEIDDHTASTTNEPTLKYKELTDKDIMFALLDGEVSKDEITDNMFREVKIIAKALAADKRKSKNDA